MLIEFVNHSSFIARSGSVSLLCDFWHSASAFDDGWELLCPTEMQYSDFSSITHIWFSHEHPDHFSPPEVRQIPEEARKNITVLFQSTKDKRVVSFCRKLGFKDVIELDPWQTYTIADGFDISCAPHGATWGDVDSWLCIKTPDCTILNVNDCDIENPDDLQSIKGHAGEIDLLAVQFSYASKQGDANRTAWISETRDYHLSWLGTKIGALAPRHTLPFASFVYFSHQENRYLNAGIISVHDACETIAEMGSAPVVLYPSDTWTVGSQPNNTYALQRYQERYDWLAALPKDEFATHESVSAEALQLAASDMITKICENITLRQVKQHIAMLHAGIRIDDKMGKLARRLDTAWSAWQGRCELNLIWIEDLAQAFSFSLDDGLVPVELVADQCHIRLSSEALHFCFAVPYGGETLHINGRYQKVTNDGWRYLSCIFHLYRQLDQQFTLPKSLLLDRIGKVIRLPKLRPS